MAADDRRQEQEHKTMTVDEWRQYDALSDLVVALEEYQNINVWPKRKRELAAKGLRMFLGLPCDG